MDTGIALQATLPVTSSRAARHTAASSVGWLEGPLSACSLRPNLKVFQWPVDLAATEQSKLFATFPLGMHKLFQQVYATDDDILCFGLMDKRTAQTREPNRTNDFAAIHAIAVRKNGGLAVGNNIVTNEFGRWLAELDQIVLKLTDSEANLIGLNYWIQSNLQTIKLAKK